MNFPSKKDSKLLSGLLSQKNLRKFDAYLTLAIVNQFAGYELGQNPSRLLSFLVEIDSSSLSKVTKELALLGARVTKQVFVPTEEIKIIICVDTSIVGLLWMSGLTAVSEIALANPLSPNRPDDRKETAPVNPPALADKLPKILSKKLFVVVDNGCPFAHDNLLTSSGKTRAVAIWDQDLNPDFDSSLTGAPIGFQYGRQVKRKQLQTWIDRAKNKSTGVIDEDQCYFFADNAPVKPRASHGAHTLGLLLGKAQSASLQTKQNNCFENAEPNLQTPSDESDYLFVQLPRRVMLAPSSTQMQRCILDAVDYAIAVAQNSKDTVKQIVFVVCYGSPMGPHDGSSILERALDERIRRLKTVKIDLQIVFPSGNTFDQKAHALINVRPKVTESLAWWSPPDSDVSSFCELWFYIPEKKTLETAKITLCFEGDVNQFPIYIGKVTETAVFTYPSLINPKVVIVCLQKNNQLQVLICNAATAMGADNVGRGISGRMVVSIASETALPPVHAYCSWGGRNWGYAQRVQKTKFFSDSAGVSVSGDGSLLGSGCGQTTFLVGGFEKSEPRRRAQYSGSGTSRSLPEGKLTTMLAITEESSVLGGLLCNTNRSNSVLRVNGTSVAAPQLGRALAALGTIAAIPTGPPLKPPSNELFTEPTNYEYGELRLKY
jgi:hypothetical protein